MATACGGDGSASGAGRGRDAGEGEERESEGEIRGGAGRFWRGQGVEGEGTRAAAVARMRAVCGDHAPCPSGARRGTTGVGQSAGPSYWADRVSGPGKSLSPFLFSFLIF